MLNFTYIGGNLEQFKQAQQNLQMVIDLTNIYHIFVWSILLVHTEGHSS